MLFFDAKCSKKSIFAFIPNKMLFFEHFCLKKNVFAQTKGFSSEKRLKYFFFEQKCSLFEQKCSFLMQKCSKKSIFALFTK
jgi:hypothetical protein